MKSNSPATSSGKTTRNGGPVGEPSEPGTNSSSPRNYLSDVLALTLTLP